MSSLRDRIDEKVGALNRNNYVDHIDALVEEGWDRERAKKAVTKRLEWRDDKGLAKSVDKKRDIQSEVLGVPVPDVFPAMGAELTGLGAGIADLLGADVSDTKQDRDRALSQLRQQSLGQSIVGQIAPYLATGALTGALGATLPRAMALGAVEGGAVLPEGEGSRTLNAALGAAGVPVVAGATRLATRGVDRAIRPGKPVVPAARAPGSHLMSALREAVEVDGVVDPKRASYLAGVLGETQSKKIGGYGLLSKTPLELSANLDKASDRVVDESLDSLKAILSNTTKGSKQRGATIAKENLVAARNLEKDYLSRQANDLAQRAKGVRVKVPNDIGEAFALRMNEIAEEHGISQSSLRRIGNKVYKADNLESLNDASRTLNKLRNTDDPALYDDLIEVSDELSNIINGLEVDEAGKAVLTDLQINRQGWNDYFSTWRTTAGEGTNLLGSARQGVEDSVLTESNILSRLTKPEGVDSLTSLINREGVWDDRTGRRIAKALGKAEDGANASVLEQGIEQLKNLDSSNIPAFQRAVKAGQLEREFTTSVRGDSLQPFSSLDPDPTTSVVEKIRPVRDETVTDHLANFLKIFTKAAPDDKARLADLISKEDFSYKGMNEIQDILGRQIPASGIRGNLKKLSAPVGVSAGLGGALYGDLKENR